MNEGVRRWTLLSDDRSTGPVARMMSTLTTVTDTLLLIGGARANEVLSGVLCTDDGWGASVLL